MRRLLCATACCLALGPAAMAQDDDRGRLIEFLESQLSDGDDRQVRIDGFRGALSSEAQLDRLSISDADGEWLILEGAQLNWRRAALLTGALEVEALTADRLTVLRAPLPAEGPDLPAPEATPFALPDLPVSISVGTLSIARVELGAPVMGIAATLSVNGAAELANGSGTADLQLQRLDGPEGVFSLTAGFENETRVASVDLLLEEAPGGLAVELLNLPDAPASRLAVSGEGPLDDISVDLSLATDGTQRVTGSLQSARDETNAAQIVEIDLSGDLSPLMAAEYRAFFGTDSTLAAEINRDDQGATRLNDLRLSSAALTLAGNVALDAESRLVLVDIDGQVTPPQGQDVVVLPVAGAATTVSGADLDIAFDASNSDTFSLLADVTDLVSDDLGIETAQITANGRLLPTDTAIGQVNAAIEIGLSGLRHSDPALAQALGSNVDLTSELDWATDAPISLSNISIAAGNVTATGEISAMPAEGQIPVTFDLNTTVPNLSRFSGLSGQDLSGAVQAQVSGTFDALSGAFDVALQGSGRDLGAAPALPPNLLAGQTQLDVQAARDAQGLRLERLALDGTEVFVNASGDLSSQGGGMTAEARINDLALLRPEVSGPATLSADIESVTDGWAFAADITAPGDLRANGTGQIELPGGLLDIPADGPLPISFDVTANLSDLSAYAGLAGVGLAGGLNAQLSGTGDARDQTFDIALTGTGQDLRAAPTLPNALLAGETQLSVQAANTPTGLVIETLRLDGSELSVSAAGDLTDGGDGLSGTARLSDLGLFTTAVRGPAAVTADVAPASDGWRIAADLTGPGGMTARANGLVGMDGGRVDLQTTGALPLALANRVIAPRSVTGQLAFDLAVRGTPGLEAVSGRFSTAGARLAAPSFRVSLENLGLNGNLSGGRVSFNGGATVSSGGQIGLTGTIDAAGPGIPGGIDITMDAVRLADPTLYEILIARGDLSVTGPLASFPRVAGRIDLGASELRVPETGLGSAPPIPEISHIGEGGAERQTRAAAGLLASRGGGGGSGAVGLDVQINAPARIFLRGRGIDAEFGGAIRIAGTTAAIIPSGQFDLVRGRISILGTRLDLTEGSATLQGDFDPFLRLRAESQAGEYRVTIAVDGPASAPEIALSSDPFLPEDEILAQLLFGRSVSALSPVQLLQLADAASSLAGGSTNGGLLSNLREGLGLDDLDLQTDAEGNAAVRAGRYLSENVYTDVTIGAEGDSTLSLNIDLTPDITARGSFSSDGSSGVGAFFERDY